MLSFTCIVSNVFQYLHAGHLRLNDRFSTKLAYF